MKFKTKLALGFFAMYLAITNVAAQQNNTFSCNFTSVVATKWSNGEWNNARFVPRTNQFLIKIENGNVDVKSIAEHLGGWGGVDVACAYIDSIDNESRHYRCMQKVVSSKMLIFNPTSKNGALITPDGALYADSWKLKDDVGIEFFKCK
jgi:hypothetical protein